jgi:DNA repair protein RecO
MSYRIHKEVDEGIVLVKKQILQSDVLIVVLTCHFGKIALLAKGVKKITSKRISALQTGNIVKIIFSEKNNTLRYLNSVELISHLSAIKKDLVKIQYLYILLFMFEKLVPDSQKDPDVYNVCKRLLIQLAKEKTNSVFLTKAMSEVLTQLGYGRCHTYDECVSITEEIIGKKMPAMLV